MALLGEILKGRCNLKVTIAQIGENRLKRVLVDDKENSPEKLCEVLSSDFKNVCECYMDEPNVVITADITDDGIEFYAHITAKRVKSIGVLTV